MGAENMDISKREILTEEFCVPGYKSEIRLLKYSPVAKSVKPVMIFIHGGGWIGGKPEVVENYCKAISDRLDYAVVSVDYHLAPEHKFPEGLEDCYNAARWVYSNADKIGIDPNRMCVSGDSAGGNYASVLCLLSKERKEFSFTHQDVFQRIFEKGICLYIATRKNMKRIMTKGQHQLFKMRSMIETLWGILKERFLIVSHLARSPHGLFRHYFYSIIAFMLVNKEKKLLSMG